METPVEYTEHTSKTSSINAESMHATGGTPHSKRMHSKRMHAKRMHAKRMHAKRYPSMGLPGGEKGSAVVKGTCVRACVGMPGVCVLRVCVRERRGEAGKRTFRRDWLQSLPRICEAPARAGVEGGCSLPRCLTASL